MKDINGIYSKLIAAPDDTDIVKLNADNGLDKFYYKKEKIPSAYVKDTLFKLTVGSGLVTDTNCTTSTPCSPVTGLET